jgi:subtilisin family serine protease
MTNRRPASLLFGAALLSAGVAATVVAQEPRLRHDAARRDEIVAHLREGASPRASMLALSRDPGGPVMVDVFVRGGAGAAVQVVAHGGRLGTQAGGWMTARVPLAQMRALARAPGVTALEPSAVANPLEDSSKVEIGATLVRRRGLNDQWEGATGRGAIVGTVDSGIDFANLDFIDDDVGLSRVLFLWDQTLAGRTPGTIGGVTFSYGDECTRTMLGPNGSCRSREVEGHGTHVAGTAAGDGSASRRGTSGYSFTGVAPGADLIVVKTNFSFTGIADGVNYIFRRAEALGRPAVVNLSLGAQYGPHDGKEALSIMIDSLSGPGRIVVAAAGNEGTNLPRPPSVIYPFIHADTAVAPADSSEIRFEVPRYIPRSGAGNDVILIDAVYPPGDDVELTVVRPNGTRVDIPYAATDSVVSFDAAGGVVGYNGTHQDEAAVLGDSLSLAGFIAPASPMRVAELFVGEWVTGARAPSRGTWRVIFRRAGGAGRRAVDANLVLFTIVSDSIVNGQDLQTEVSFTIGATNRRLVGVPGDATRAITVAAYNTDSGTYRSADGSFQSFPGVAVATGDLLYFSSPGPRTDGVLKPEISAPGRIFSSLSAYGHEDARDIYSDSAHVIYQGTSMAAPHVTGTVALLLAERPSLTPEQAKGALTSTARWDAFTAVSRATGDPGGRPNWSWGYGKLWVPGALTAVRPATPLASAVRASASDAPRIRPTSTSRRGTLLPLQSVRLSASDADTLLVRKLDFLITGSDPAFRLAIALDVNRDGVLDPSEPLLVTSAETVVTPAGTVISLALPGDTLRIPRGGTVDVLVVGLLSGGSPNGTEFTATLVAATSIAEGARSGALVNFAGQGTGPAVARTTLLAANEQLNLTQNPVRRSPLILNFQPTRRIEIYDFTGRLTKRFLPAASDVRVEWDLRNTGGTQVANGVYVIVMELQSGAVVRQKLFIAR